MKIILASGSPRRQELLQSVGLLGAVKKPDMKEEMGSDETPLQYVKRNAFEKASYVASGLKTKSVVLAADTVVILDGRVLEKPASKAQAIAMLQALSGRSHQVVTAYALLGVLHPKEVQKVRAVETKVVFRGLTEEEIEAYANTKEPYDKAGGYGIQGAGGAFVTEIHGSYTNVVGLPLAQVCEDLATEFGAFTPEFDVP